MYWFTAIMFNIGHFSPVFNHMNIPINFRSPLTKKLDWRLETLVRQCIWTGLCIHSL